MQALVYTSLATGILAALVFLSMVWIEPSENALKLIITLGVLFVIQAGVYLVVRDVKEESSGKKNGTIAK
jgi:uncharacterized membrane protein